jgi:membrane protease YdiL (CAAX protease family)
MNPTRTLLPGLAGPLIVALGLLVLHSAPMVFLTYHLGLCLLLPALISRRAGLSWSAHGERLGLSRRGLCAGLALGLLSGLAPPIVFAAAPSLFPDAVRLRSALATWGLDSTAPAAFLFFMALVNGPAEELFWRGWLLRDPATSRGVRLALALLFASYHVLTVGRLATSTGAAVLMLAGVLGGAFFWTWSRWRWGSVWPALLSHTGATCGYLYICARVLDAG